MTVSPKNLFNSPTAARDDASSLPAELLEILAESESGTPLSSLRIERIVSPPNHASDPGFWYDQATTEWVVLLRGEATLRFENHDAESETVDLRPGDHLEIPPHQRHRIDATSPNEPTLWLAVHWD